MDVDQHLADQDGVISRRQAIAAGLRPSDIARKLRRREWASVHDGVYVDHTGPLTWHQRAWAAVLFSWPAALSHESALRAGDGPGRRNRDDSTIHVAVSRHRRLIAPPGVRLHRMTGFSARARWNLGPPRIGYEEAVLDVAAAALTDLDAVAVLSDACGSRFTTALRLLDRLDRRTRIPRRAWLRSVLRDVVEGTCSVLEHGYLTRIERPHGLPKGQRQAEARPDGTLVLRDVDYPDLGLIVELDGRLFHSSTRARDRDMDRDLDAAVDQGRETVRLSYGQVFERSCATARKLGTIMRRRGWLGEPDACPDCG